MYQGEEYEHYGLDERGRHRLYSDRLKKHIVISDNEYNSLYGNLRGSTTDNLLLLQSFVGTVRKTPSFKHTEEI